MAFHTYDLELFEKILRIEKVKDIDMSNLVYLIIKEDKYYAFFQKFCNYLNENNIILDKEKKVFKSHIRNIQKFMIP